MLLFFSKTVSDSGINIWSSVIVWVRAILKDGKKLFPESTSQVVETVTSLPDPRVRFVGEQREEQRRKI